MAAQNPVQISTFQYYLWKLKHLPTPVLLLINAIFVTVIYFFPQRPLELVKEWYPGSVKTYPTVQIVTPSFEPIPTTPPFPTLPPAPTEPIAQEPVSQPEPVVGVYVPEQYIQAVVDPAPTVEVLPSPYPTANEARVEAWVAAPASTMTPSPGPGDPGFADSFQEPPECNVFIGYVGEKREYCAGVYATQTEEALP